MERTMQHEAHGDTIVTLGHSLDEGGVETTVVLVLENLEQTMDIAAPMTPAEARGLAVRLWTFATNAENGTEVPC